MAVRKTSSRRSSGSSSNDKHNKIVGVIVGIVVIVAMTQDGDDKGSKPPTTGTSNICTETFKGGC